MLLLVTNMGHHKKPWEDVPIEVIIEWERQNREHRDPHREQLRIPAPEPVPANYQKEKDEEHKIIIKLV